MTNQLLSRETPFNLTFKIEAVILLELGLPSYRIEAYDKWWNTKDLKVNLDLLEEIWEKA